MTEEKKEGGCCSTSGGHGHESGGPSGCCWGKKLIIGLLLGALIFAAGMLFAKSQCHPGGFCPFFSGAPVK